MLMVLLLVHSLLGALLLKLTRQVKSTMIVTLLTMSVGWVLAFMLHQQVPVSTTGLLYHVKIDWIQSWGVSFYLALDTFSMSMVILTLFVDTVIVMSAPILIKKNLRFYMSIFLVMQTMMLGVFMAWDGFLYYIFWEAVLIPMYLCIGVWGSEMRGDAAVKFFLFTFLGSVVMLIAIIYLGVKANGFSIDAWYQLKLSFTEQLYIFLAFFIAFAVKIPVWPLHTWLPDAHTEAPAGGSILLAALMLKMGGYGLLRFAWPIAPDAAWFLAPWMIALGLIAIVYVGYVAMSQSDMKRLIAYSSVAHMGFVLLGLFIIVGLEHETDVRMAWNGAIIQMITHAFGSGALFLAFGLMYTRTKERRIQAMQGLAESMPYCAAFFLVFLFSNIAVPGTAGFVGEWMIVLATMKSMPFIAILASLTLIISATYSLVLMRNVFYGPAIQFYQDFDLSERLICGLMVTMIFVIGLYPKALVDYIDPSTTRIWSNIQMKLDRGMA